MEPRANQPRAEERGAAVCQPRTHLPAHLEGQAKRGSLWRYLRHNGKKYNKRKGKNSGRGLIPGRVDISERPAIAPEKSRIGDWEGDTVIGRGQRAAILTHVDRKSKYTKLAILPDKSAASVQSACDASLLPIAHKIETITYDNGKDSPATPESQQGWKPKSTSPSLIIPGSGD